MLRFKLDIRPRKLSKARPTFQVTWAEWLSVIQGRRSVFRSHQLELAATGRTDHFDRWWNPAVENQATDRAFRIGQKKNLLRPSLILESPPSESYRWWDGYPFPFACRMDHYLQDIPSNYIAHAEDNNRRSRHRLFSMSA